MSLSHSSVPGKFLAGAMFVATLGFTVGAHGQVRTDFDGRARPGTLVLHCDDAFEEQDIKEVRSDGHGNFVSVVNTVGDWIRHGYGELHTSRDGTRLVRQYGRKFKVYAGVDLSIDLDTKAGAQEAALIYRATRPRFILRTTPRAMQAYASEETRRRFLHRVNASRQGWERELKALYRALDSTRFGYSRGELAGIRGNLHGGLSRVMSVSFCGQRHNIAMDVRWRRYVPGNIGGQGSP